MILPSLSISSASRSGLSICHDARNTMLCGRHSLEPLFVWLGGETRPGAEKKASRGCGNRVRDSQGVLLEQPINAYGEDVRHDLIDTFVPTDFNVLRLVVIVAKVAALHDRESVSGRKQRLIVMFSPNGTVPSNFGRMKLAIIFS